MHRLIFIALILIAHEMVFAQDSVLGLLKNNLQQANHFYEQKQYEKALKYFNLANQSKIDINTQLKIARCLYFIKNYAQAGRIYATVSSVSPLQMPDLLYYAELNISIGNHQRALECYNEILNMKPGDPAVLQKIWQLNNLHVLYEDSLHYTVRPLPVNTKAAELSPVAFDKGIVFLSDRRKVDLRNPDQEGGDSPFNLFYSKMDTDSSATGFATKFRKPINFGKLFHWNSSLGPVSFYAEDSKCVFAGLSNEAASDGTYKLQIFFTERKSGKWSIPKPFYHNNKEYNLTDPSISADGKMLYFTSDRPGGFGENDIYRSEWREDKWSAPENLGDNINTSNSESFPYLYYSTLYFSSDGHPGLGGLDIFSTIVSGNNEYDIRNLGYPINSNSDDFGFVLRTGSQGFFSSNRKNGGFDDDLYEFEMDFRTYPFEISGVIKLTQSASAVALNHWPMANTAIELVDYNRHQVIARTQTDELGKFSVSIPWFSKYVLRLVDNENQQYIVSLEINRESSENSNYEIVVVKQSFNGSQKANFESE